MLQIYAYLLSDTSMIKTRALSEDPSPDPESYYLSDAAYMSARMTLLETEAIILRTLSFAIQVVMPHHLALTFLQTLGTLPQSPTAKSRALAARTNAHLNTALFSPQSLYLTHQPVALAVAAIYLAAKETGMKLPSCEWWEVFDVEREDLGFLVVGLGSCESWAKQEEEKWATVACPLTIMEVKSHMERRKLQND